MKAEVTRTGIRIIVETEKDEKAIGRFLKDSPKYLWLNGGTYSSNSGWESLYIRKLGKTELLQR